MGECCHLYLYGGTDLGVNGLLDLRRCHGLVEERIIETDGADRHLLVAYQDLFVRQSE
jgi:hypothetical protein